MLDGTAVQLPHVFDHSRCLYSQESMVLSPLFFAQVSVTVVPDVEAERLKGRAGAVSADASAEAGPWPVPFSARTSNV